MRRSRAIAESPSVSNEAFRAFHVDACIPRLYIAHGFMLHNRTSQPMFRFRLLTFFSFVAGAAVFVAGFSSNRRPAAPTDHTKAGIDVLEAEKFASLRGKRVGLITNQTGLDLYGHRTIDLLARAESVKLVRIFSPEHGIAGTADATVANQADAATGLPVFSLYGATRRPTTEMLDGLDTLVFDIQDAGVRFYTYITTMAYAMEAAAHQHIAFFVLDRPNPLGGDKIEGPMLDRDRISFVGYFPMPVRYGMTMGELAQMFNSEDKIGADLHVVAMEDWHRRDTFDMTGLAWIAPSPALRTLRANFLYPGVEILQAGGVSVGRGTPTPFELFGAPSIDSPALLAELNRGAVPGVQFAAAQFTPSSGVYSGQVCNGISIEVRDRDAFQPVLMGLEIASALHRLYPEKFQVAKMIELLGSQSTIDRLERGDD
ncbi:MAG: exo-beta-N-acetylmuramidase NamZ family protein, partial [Candidatus Acidiferrales bacterium]